MKKIVVACISLFYFANLVKADTINGILFRHITFQEALSLAKKENKMVFLHGFADWCGHCKTMAETVYLDSALGVFYNANFVCIKLDMEKEGKELARSYRITKYPGLLFLDASGNIVHRTTGEQKIPEMLQCNSSV